MSLPAGIIPRGLTREQAAEYVGVEPATFDKYRQRDLLPGPMRGTMRWDRRALDRAMDRLSGLDEQSPARVEEDPYMAGLGNGERRVPGR